MMIADFVEHIDSYIYKQELIYRSIIVSANEKESYVLKRRLEDADHSILSISDVSSLCQNLNAIDERIVIITKENLKGLIEYIHDKNGGILESSYNCLAFSYNIEDELVDELKMWYIDFTDNNRNNTIIMDKTYKNLLYLQKNIL